MNISEKRHSELYDAIHSPIMDLRVLNNAGLSIEDMDDKLFKLVGEIYDNLKTVLNLHKTS